MRAKNETRLNNELNNTNKCANAIRQIVNLQLCNSN